MRKTALLMAMLVCISAVSVPTSAKALCLSENAEPHIVHIATAVPEGKAACAVAQLESADAPRMDFPPVLYVGYAAEFALNPCERVRIFHLRE